MGRISMSVGQKSFDKGDTAEIEGRCAGIFVVDGVVAHSDETISAGQGAYSEAGALYEIKSPNATIVQFNLTLDEADHIGQDQQTFDVVAGEVVFRLDQISFPVDAIAYRHVHAGTGYRHLVKGRLQIETDDHSFFVAPGESWFEPENSPVRATNISPSETSFVRAMILPLDYLGQPTIQYLNAEDADKPRLQSNYRFFDQVIDLSDH